MNCTTPNHHRRTPSSIATEAEVMRLIELWRGRGLTWREVAERLNEKGHRFSEASARKFMQGQVKVA